MNALTCNLVTPEKLLFSASVEMVVVPGLEGDFGVLAQHAPFISIIRPGVVELHNGNNVEKFFISAGYAETHGTECTILAESAEPLSALNKEKLEADLLKARKDLEYAADEAARARAETAISIIDAKQRLL
jgi:F-type H+-transporting ATPase subunit epsilon